MPATDTQKAKEEKFSLKKKEQPTTERHLGYKQKKFLFDSRLTQDILLFVTFSKIRNGCSCNTIPGLTQALMHIPLPYTDMKYTLEKNIYCMSTVRKIILSKLFKNK